NQPSLDRVNADEEDYWNCRSRRFCWQRRDSASGNHGDPTTDQIGGLCGHAIIVTLRKTALDEDVSALDEAGFQQTLLKCSIERQVITRSTGAQNTDYRKSWLLRPYRQRPRRRRASEEGEEGTAVHGSDHSITSSARASSVGGISMPSVLAV